VITITLNIQVFKKNSPPSNANPYKIIYVGDSTYINKFARVSRGEENLSVATGSQCLEIAMLEAMYIFLCNHTLPNVKEPK